VYTCTPIFGICKSKSKLVGKIHGQIQIQIACFRVGVQFRPAGREGNGWAYPCRMLVAGAAPSEELAKGGAAPLAQSPPGGDQKRNAGAEREDAACGRGVRAEKSVGVFPRRTGPRTNLWAVAAGAETGANSASRLLCCRPKSPPDRSLVIPAGPSLLVL
jgi:hypothetical protein